MTLVSKINKFLRATWMPETKFGRLVANDPRLVRDLRAGRAPMPTMVARIETFIAQNQGMKLRR